MFLIVFLVYELKCFYCTTPQSNSSIRKEYISILLPRYTKINVICYLNFRDISVGCTLYRYPLIYARKYRKKWVGNMKKKDIQHLPFVDVFDMFV